jgi:hypothetical protein
MQSIAAQHAAHTCMPSASCRAASARRPSAAASALSPSALAARAADSCTAPSRAARREASSDSRAALLWGLGWFWVVSVGSAGGCV